MGNPYNSIYDDIDDWSGSVTYLKNYIAYDSHTAGAESFVFTPPAPFATAAKFVCKSFNTNYIFYDNYTITATFEQTP